MMKSSLLDAGLSLLIPALILAHLAIAPYTKVEESFSLQATHDILAFGVPFGDDVDGQLRSRYDHLTFSGAVPRSFIGPLVLSGVSRPIVFLLSFIHPQTIVRGVLGLFNSLALLAFRNGLAKAFGRSTANWYVLLQASQFHVVFYASRTLPNMFAFGLSTIALGGFLPIPGVSLSVTEKSHRLSLYLLTFSGIVFRSELALLLATMILYHLLFSHLSIRKVIIPAGALGAIVGLLTSISVDSFFWRTNYPLWPELYSFVFNVIEGEASAWGTSPWHYYLTSALPRLLLNPLSPILLLPLPVLLPATRYRSMSMLVPALAYILIYSVQPHKEWRFIVYVVPSLTAVSAMGASAIWTRRHKTFSYRVLSLAVVASVLASFLASMSMAAVSSLNYPGGTALARLHQLAADDGVGRTAVRVHMDILACMTGISRFQERASPVRDVARSEASWVYDKTENATLLSRPEFWGRFDYALAEDPAKVLGNWTVLEGVNGFAGLKLERGNVDTASLVKQSGGLVESLHLFEDWVRRRLTKGWWVSIRMEPRIYILENSDKQQ